MSLLLCPGELMCIYPYVYFILLLVLNQLMGFCGVHHICSYVWIQKHMCYTVDTERV